MSYYANRSSASEDGLTKSQRYYRRHREQRQADAREAMRAKRAVDPEAAAQYLREYTETHRAEAAANIQRWRERNPDKVAAHRALRKAVRIGVLVRPSTCSKCGASGRIQAHHHNGYAPDHHLDVVWLCHSCHQRLAE